jgi:hypothetical protein
MKEKWNKVQEAIFRGLLGSSSTAQRRTTEGMPEI